MAKQVINRGTVAGDGTGESPFVGMGKANENFTELYDQAAALAVSVASAAAAAEAAGIAAAIVEVNEVPNSLQFPVGGAARTLYIAADTGLIFRWTGATYQQVTLALDASGNFTAVVLNQTNTLAGLLSLSGGNGQIAVANEKDALVVYYGGVTDGVVFRKSHVVAELIIAEAHIDAILANTVSVVRDGSSNPPLINDRSMFDIATGVITIPPDALYMDITMLVEWSTADAGSTCKLDIEYFDAAATPQWASLTDAGLSRAVSTVAVAGVPVVQEYPKVPLVLSGLQPYPIRFILSSSGGTHSVSPRVNLYIKFLA